MEEIRYAADCPREQNGHVTYCLLLERIKAGSADLESLLFFIFKTLGKVLEPFEILVDATNFTKLNEIAPVWIAQMVAIMPASTSQLLTRVVVFS